MSMNFKRIIHLLGALLIIIALSMTPSLLVSILYKEYECTKAFLITIGICLLMGVLFNRRNNPSLSSIRMRDGFLIVTGSWLFASLFGAVPFVLSGAISNPINAFFETCSGFSTTGASILTDIEALPVSMLFWRSFTHWLGGMGIVVFAMALLPKLGISGQLLAVAEMPAPTLDKLTPRFSDTAKSLYKMYIFITVLETVLLSLGGLTIIDALIHTFGTVGTGGFSSHAESIAYFNSYYVQWVITIFMIISGTNFNLFYISIKNGIKRMFGDEEFKLYISIIAIFTLLITLDLALTANETNLFGALTVSAFQVSSIITTTGYASTDFDLWPTFAKMLLFTLMFIGASSSSTGGGVKVIRILVSFKLILRGFALKTHENRIVNIKVNGKQVASETISNIANFIFFYILLLFVGTFIIAFDNFDVVTSFTSVIACLGNIGPGFSLVGPTMNYSIFSGFSKLVLSFLMIAGRLELFTFFILFSRYYRDSNRA
ncbi:MAG: TrkH family potassium uptake protein [Clostridiales bacterium]|nr:TrkH family potassium uptake protein [Clostridiales bacterium]